MKHDPTLCTACPRRCGADRVSGRGGFCHAPDTVLLSRAALHMWEEPCLSGTRGSGTVFFTGCPLSCVYCQNKTISRGENGYPVTEERFVSILLSLQEKGAHNVNLVTPTHYAPFLASALKRAREAGLTIPIVYNCGGYEGLEALRSLRGLIDIYLPDFKYADAEAARRYSAAPDYFEVAKASLREMVDQCKEALFDQDGIMQKGVIVRHLMLPGNYRNSHDVIKYLATTYGNKIYISLMNQYTPIGDIGERFPELASTVSDKEYRRLVAYAVRLGVTQGFTQEGGAATESFIPAFDGEGIL